MTARSRRRSAGARRSAAFSPAVIAGLTHWLRADDLALADGTPVTAWSDRVSGGGAATQATAAAQPVYKPTALNGLPAVRFDGTDDVLSYGSVNWTATFTVFAVSTLSAFLTNRGPLGGDSNALPNRMFQLRHNAANNVQLIGFHSNGGALNSSTTAVTGQTSPSVLSGYRSDTEIRVLFNGASSSNAVSTAGTTGSSTATLPLVVGSSASVSAGLFAGDVAEILTYSRALTLSERQQVHAYLGTRYGITMGAL